MITNLQDLTVATTNDDGFNKAIAVENLGLTVVIGG